MPNIVVLLGQDEIDALIKLALSELRDAKSQARLIIRNELERHGLLPIQEPDQSNTDSRNENYD
jgi:hypothetical protein